MTRRLGALLIIMSSALACGRPSAQMTLVVDADEELVSPGGHLYYRTLDPAGGPARAFVSAPLSLGAERGVGEAALPERISFVPEDGNTDVRATVEVGLLSRSVANGGTIRVAQLVDLDFQPYTHVEREVRLEGVQCLLEYVCCEGDAEVPVDSATRCVPVRCASNPFMACAASDPSYTCIDSRCVPVGECEDGQVAGCGGPTLGDPACRGTVECVDGRWPDECDGVERQAGGEICDSGVDEDCDLAIDEAPCECATGDCVVEYDIAAGLEANLVPGPGAESRASQRGALGWRYYRDERSMFGPHGSLDVPTLPLTLIEFAMHDGDQVGWRAGDQGCQMGAPNVFVRLDAAPGEPVSSGGTHVATAVENCNQLAIEWTAPTAGEAELEIFASVRAHPESDMDWHLYVRRDGILEELQSAYLVSTYGGVAAHGAERSEVVETASEPYRFSASEALERGDAFVLYARVGDHDANDETYLRGGIRFRPR